MSNWFGTFFKKAETVLEKFFTDTNWTHAAGVALNLAAPLVETLVTLTGGAAAGTAATSVLNMIKTDFGTASVLLTQIQENINAPVTSQLTAVLNSIKSNLSTIESEAGVKNTSSATEISTVTNTIIGELDAIIAAIPTTAATPSTTVSPTPTTSPTPVGIIS